MNTIMLERQASKLDRRDLPPLGDVDRLHHPGNLIDKGDGSRDVVDDRHVSDLLPWHRHILQQLQHCMWHVLQSSGRRDGRVR